MSCWSRFDANLFPHLRGAGAAGRALSRQNDYALNGAESPSIDALVGSPTHLALLLRRRRSLLVLDAVPNASFHFSRRAHDDALIRRLVALDSSATADDDDAESTQRLASVLKFDVDSNGANSDDVIVSVAFGDALASRLVVVTSSGRLFVWLWSAANCVWNVAVVNERMWSVALCPPSLRVLEAAVVDDDDARLLLWLQVSAAHDQIDDVRLCSRPLRYRESRTATTSSASLAPAGSASSAAGFAATSTPTITTSSSSSAAAGTAVSSIKSPEQDASAAAVLQKLDLADGRRILGSAKNKAASLMGRMRDGVTRLRNRTGAANGDIDDVQAPTLVVDVADASMVAEMHQAEAVAAASTSGGKFSSAFADATRNPTVEFTAGATWRNAALFGAGRFDGAWIVARGDDAVYFWSRATGIVVLVASDVTRLIFARERGGALLQCSRDTGKVTRIVPVAECIAAAALASTRPFASGDDGCSEACFDRRPVCELAEWQPIEGGAQMLAHEQALVVVDAERSAVNVYSLASGELRNSQVVKSPLVPIVQRNVPPAVMHGDGLHLWRQTPPWPPASGAIVGGVSAESLLSLALECDAWALEQLAGHRLLTSVAAAVEAEDSTLALRAASLLAPRLSTPALLVWLLDPLPSARTFLVGEIRSFLARLDGATAADIDEVSAGERRHRLETAYQAATPLALQLRPLLAQYLSLVAGDDASPTLAPTESLWTMPHASLVRLAQCDAERGMRLAVEAVGTLDEPMSAAVVARICSDDDLFHFDWLVRVCFVARPERVVPVCEAVDAACVADKAIAARFLSSGGAFVRACDALPAPALGVHFNGAQTAARIALLRRCGRDVDAMFELLVQRDWSAATALFSAVAASGDAARHERCLCCSSTSCSRVAPPSSCAHCSQRRSVVPASFDATALQLRLARQTRGAAPSGALVKRDSGALAVSDVRDALLARTTDASRAQLLDEASPAIEL
jgi:hypothetical protein